MGIELTHSDKHKYLAHFWDCTCNLCQNYYRGGADQLKKLRNLTPDEVVEEIAGLVENWLPIFDKTCAEIEKSNPEELNDYVDYALGTLAREIAILKVVEREKLEHLICLFCGKCQVPKDINNTDKRWSDWRYYKTSCNALKELADELTREDRE